MDTSTFYANGCFQPAWNPLDPEGAKRKTHHRGHRVRRESRAGRFVLVVSVTSLVRLLGCGSAALRKPFVQCVTDGFRIVQCRVKVP